MPAVRLKLSNLQATNRLGALLAEELTAGDIIALSGGVGVGKSALARAIIQSLDPAEDDVPSPTFTLVQSYALYDGTPLWHLDLYRLEGPMEAMALGLDDAFVDAVCLIEWPDRLQNFLPKTSLSIHLDANVADANLLDNAVGDSSVRFADIVAPSHWADRIKNLLPRISEVSD